MSLSDRKDDRTRPGSRATVAGENAIAFCRTWNRAGYDRAKGEDLNGASSRDLESLQGLEASALVHLLGLA